jgi:glutathione S-transferase
MGRYDMEARLMILIGQFDSPFVRRVGIALRLYGMDFEHRPWSSFGDAERIAPYNPLRRVPTLLLEGGEVLIESAAILDALDGMVGPERAMTPAGGPERRRALQICALGTGLADKAVGLVYERVLHAEPSPAWVERCGKQIGDVLAALERSRAEVASPFWFGPAVGHADIAVACALRFLRDAHPTLFDPARLLALARHAATCEALPAFQSVTQRFIPPA